MKAKLKNWLNGTERGVSPVIGVILMVAITVIMAAVIGTFVLGLGDQIGDTQPTATISVDVDTDATDVIVSHDGGDAVDWNDLQIVAVTEEGGNSVADMTDINNGLEGDEFSIGDAEDFDFDEDTTDTGEDVTHIRIIHTPTDSYIYDNRHEFGDFGGWNTA